MLGKKSLEQDNENSEDSETKSHALDEVRTSDPVSLFSDRQEL